MNIEQEKMIVEALPSLYPMQEFEEKAIHKVIDALPSAEPKRGRWQYNNKMGTFKIFTCDQCGWNSEAEFNYCPNCGSRNEVTE